MDTNYFVCTLGEAAANPHTRPFRSVSHLIEQQAKDHPDLPAIGFYIPSAEKDGPYDTEVITFHSLHRAVLQTAGLLKPLLDFPPGGTVGLLSASSPEFLFVWLGLVWLGYSVLLVAPECSATAVASLCQECAVEILIADERNDELAREAAAETGGGGIRYVKQPFSGRDIFAVLRSTAVEDIPAAVVEADTVAYFHHTSGTSSGKPKPIPQTHHGAVGVLPALDERGRASFTTTPLYHGGPADTFRAWTSNAMIWLFPSKHVPITATNIVRCLEASRRAAEEDGFPAVEYFGAVPYVLRMMADGEQASTWLRSMALVSVGGAALPAALGDRIVENGVKLVSRFGSAECGFLLASHRDYARDKDWQYLRFSPKSTQLRFEQREDGLSELVVLPGWPHMAKRNRDDGSYATSDLFEPHPTQRDAWRFHSRADAQLTLVTGLKFDPASLEDAIVAATSYIHQALVFGNQKPYPGVLLFRSVDAQHVTDKDLIQELGPVVDKCCLRGQAHARIPRSMLVPIPYLEQPLEKSSKGTVLRSRAERRYVREIEESYNREDGIAEVICPDDELEAAVERIVQRFLPVGKEVKADTDLFQLGIDSVASIQIRKSLQRLQPESAGSLPTTIVEDCGTISGLVTHLTRMRSGAVNGIEADSEHENEEMLRLVEKYSCFREAVPQIQRINGHGHSLANEGGVVVLTGATGALGSQVLNILRNNPAISRIYCLVRAGNSSLARERVNQALSQRKFDSLGTLENDSKIEVLQTTLSDENLGLDKSIYERLTAETTTIMHLAWSVNFRMKLQSFEKDLAGLRNLINLAMSSTRKAGKPRLIFCSSVASAMAYEGELVPEKVIDNPAAASEIGYSRSKWVAEQISDRANRTESLRGKVSVFRVGQLSGDGRTGVWNLKEAWPMMLSTVELVHALPDLQDEILDWLAVDTAAHAMVEGFTVADPEDSSLRVLHVVNDNAGPTWHEMLMWMTKSAEFEILSPLEWVRRLEAKSDQGSSHPALQLLDHWKKAFQTVEHDEQQQQKARAKFEMSETRSCLPSLRQIPPVDEEYFAKLWLWIKQGMEKT